MTSQNAPAPGAGDVNKKDDSAAALKEYPYNLLYAQQMMNMAQSQAHQWEVYAFLLNQQLQMNRMESLLLLQSGAVPTLSAPDFQAMQSAVSQAAPEGATAEEQANFHAQALAAVAAAAATVPTATADANTPKPADGETPAVPAAPGADAAEGAPAAAGAEGENANGENGENAEAQGGFWNRFRIGPIVKVALIMLLLEVKPVWFFVYFFAVFLYLGGIFDPIVDWFKRHAAQQPLEAQLVGLRQREEEVAQAAPEDTPISTENTSTDEKDDEAKPPGEGELASSSDQPPASGSDGPAPAAAETGALSPKKASDDSLKGPEGEKKEGAEGDGAPAEEPPPALPWVIRFCYQLFVMFFMTLLPMWNPDPRYLQ